MPPMEMVHDVDPAQALVNALGDLSDIDLFNNQVLVAIYKRPEKTKGGIILADQTRDEDRYQGKVGLVVKLGPTAFVDDDSVKFHGQNVSVGDWVVYRPSDGWPNAVHKVDCRILQDTQIRMRVGRPDSIW